MRGRRAVLAAMTFFGVLIAGAAFVLWAGGWLDPGDKGDTTSQLATPTPSTNEALVFAVAPDESKVEFITHVLGLKLTGVFPVKEGTITLVPVSADDWRIQVRLDIRVNDVETGNAQVDALLRGVMETGDYPLAFYVASSRDLVPVTHEVVQFVLDGDLQVHNVARPHAMDVTAQWTDGEIWAVATSELDLADHGVEMPPLTGSSVIELTARLQAYLVDAAE